MQSPLSSAIAADTAAKAAGAKATTTAVKTGNADKDLLTATLLGMTIDEFNKAYPITGTTFEFGVNGSFKFNEPKDKKESSVYIGTIGQSEDTVFTDLNLNLDGIAENTLVYKKPDGQYEFRFDIKQDKIGIWIDLNYRHGGIKTNLIGSRSKLTNLGIIKSIISRPLGSRRVLGLIHWQALRLWFKGARYRTRPEPPKIDVSQ